MIFNLLIYDKNFKFEAHNMKIGLFLVDFEMFQLIQEPKFLVRFCIFPTDDKICEPEACDIKSSLISWHLFGPCSNSSKPYRPQYSNYWRAEKDI